MNIIRWFLSALAVLLADYLLKGVEVEGFGYALLFAIINTIAMAVLRPILILLTIPVTILTFGLFLLIINVLVVWISIRFTPGIHVTGFWWAAGFTLLLAIFNEMIADLVGGKEKDKK